jgi:hypothetical protein
MKPTFLVDELELRRKLLIGKEHESGGRAMFLYGHSADMIREQQAEIKALRNHRVWIEETAIKELTYEELTNEEIDQIIKQHDWYSKTWVDMVRSIESVILKKAREK